AWRASPNPHACFASFQCLLTARSGGREGMPRMSACAKRRDLRTTRTGWARGCGLSAPPSRQGNRRDSRFRSEPERRCGATPAPYVRHRALEHFSPGGFNKAGYRVLGKKIMRKVARILLAGTIASVPVSPVTVELARGEPVLRLAQAPAPAPTEEQKKKQQQQQQS